MNLQDFHAVVDSRIVERGFDYYENGNISEVEHVDKGEFCAIVAGTKDYNVYLSLDDKLNIVEHKCDCPYDLGEVCKHEVALMYHLSDSGMYNNSPNLSAVSSISRLLEMLNHDELRSLLVSLVKRSKEARAILMERL